MDTSILALVTSLVALTLSGFHCFYRKGPGGQSWGMVYEPVRIPRETPAPEDPSGSSLQAGP
jgi:hypothetical protein